MIEALLSSDLAMQTMWLFIIAGVLLVCELFAFSYFLLFIGIGVLITGVLNAFGVFGSLAAQLLSIVVCSTLALVALRPLIKRFSKPKDNYVENANLQLKVGAKAKVVEDGIIECNGTMWKSDTSKAKVGDIVQIVGFNDNIAVVESVKNKGLNSALKKL